MDIHRRRETLKQKKTVRAVALGLAVLLGLGALVGALLPLISRPDTSRTAGAGPGPAAGGERREGGTR